MKPLAVDLCCGLGGWSEGLLAEGWDVVGFDVEIHKYGEYQYPAQLVLQDILTLGGEQFRGKVQLIVASPPCQFFSYCAMPWSRAKALAAEVWADPARLEKELSLFNACVRIGKEARCPVVIENVRGAQKWVGCASWNYGSFYLWGDVPALMPITSAGSKVPGFRLDGNGSLQSAMVRQGVKAPGMNWSDPAKRGQDFTRIAGQQTLGTKNGNDWFGAGDACYLQRRHGSKSKGRKAASAMIAKIPLPLSRHIAAIYRPRA